MAGPGSEGAVIKRPFSTGRQPSMTRLQITSPRHAGEGFTARRAVKRSKRSRACGGHFRKSLIGSALTVAFLRSPHAGRGGATALRPAHLERTRGRTTLPGTVGRRWAPCLGRAEPPLIGPSPGSPDLPESRMARATPDGRQQGLYIMYCPPLIDSVEPVMKPASSPARYTTARAISSGSPRRPTGMSGRILDLSTSSGTACTISVEM